MSSSTLRDIILNMPDDAGASGGYESDGDVGGPTATRRRRPEDRWLNTYTPGPRMSEDLANRLNAIMYRFSPLFAHANTVTTRLAAQIEARRQDMMEDISEREDPPSFQPIRRGLTQSLDNLPIMVNDPMANVRRHDPPRFQNRVRRSPSPDVELSQDERNDESPLTSPPGEQVTPERQDEEEEDSDAHLHVNSSDLLALVPKLFKYAPVFLILFTKFVIDHFLGIVSFCVLILTFYHTNNIVKSEAMKTSDRNNRRLLLALLHIVACLLFIDFVESYGTKYSSLLIMVPSYQRPLGLWDLLWIVTITDCFLKLITIGLKILITLFPKKLLPFNKRGKVYCFTETLSQVYRAVVPLQPWIFFLLESYHGYEKIIAVGLTSAYIVSKGFEISRRAITLRKSFDQLLKNTNIGVLPNKTQIEAAGKHCPICHEEYSTPVLLNCSHIFCEMCVSVWLTKVQTCPLCRAQVVTSSTWRNGATSQYYQLY